MWQSDGQWWSTTDQVSASGGSVPSCSSTAPPEKEMASPAFHVSPGDGEEIVAVGGVSPAVMATASVLVAPLGSVTLSFAGYDPAVV